MEKFTENFYDILSNTYFHVYFTCVDLTAGKYTMQTRSHMKSLRNCFHKLADMVSAQAERLTHEQWFEFAAESTPSDIGMML